MRDRPAPLRLLSLSVAIVATSLLTTGAWAMDTFLPGAVVGAGLCLLLLTPLLWSLRRSAKRRRDAVQRFEARLSEVAESGWGLRVPPPGAADRGGGSTTENAVPSAPRGGIVAGGPVPVEGARPLHA